MGQFTAPPTTPHPPAHPSYTPGEYSGMDISVLHNLGTLCPHPDQRSTTNGGWHKISPAEKQRLPDNSDCAYCAVPDHIFANCPVGLEGHRYWTCLLQYLLPACHSWFPYYCPTCPFCCSFGYFFKLIQPVQKSDPVLVILLSPLSLFSISGFSLPNTVVENETYTLTDKTQTIFNHALVDTWCIGICITWWDFRPLASPSSHSVRNTLTDWSYWWTTYTSINITHLAHLCLSINDHREHVPFFVTQIGDYYLVFGIRWLKRDVVNIKFATNTLNLTHPNAVETAPCSTSLFP